MNESITPTNDSFLFDNDWCIEVEKRIDTFESGCSETISVEESKKLIYSMHYRSLYL